MAEQHVFWLGGASGKNKSGERKAPEAERYEPAIRDACEACGYEVDEYVAAQGGFGGWLAHLEHEGQQFRVFWSGKSEQLMLELNGPGGWQEVRSRSLGDVGPAGFVEGIKALLIPPDES